MPSATYERQFLPSHLDRLRQLCDVVDPCPIDTLERVQDRPEAGEVEVIITGWGAPPLSRDVVRKFLRLALIAHCAGSLKHIVDDGLFDHGVRVTTSALANAQPVAEYTLAYILRWNKKLAVYESRYRQERDGFSRTTLHQARDLGNLERTVGVVGASRVGRCLANLLRHFDLDVLLYDPMVSDAEAVELGTSKVSLDELMRSSHIVSINAPLLAETVHMIGRDQLSLMTDGALLINTARGRVVDHAALIDELGTGRISAVLDVTDPEPLPASSPLYDMDNVILTPHVAGSLGREIHRMTASTLSEVELFIREQRLEHEILAEHWSSAA